MQPRVYFDNASTTRIHPEVLTTYERLLEKYFVNSESLYSEGSEISRMLEKARLSIAGLLGVQAEDIMFTSGSSESNSAAIKGVALAMSEKKHIITTQVEHSSILGACRQMEKLFGCRVTYLPVTPAGTVSVDDLVKALDEDTCLVSVMHVNNETGAINPINEIGRIVRTRSHAYMHADLTQSMGKIPVDLTDIDMASVSAHKLEGLKGSGLLVKRKHVPFEPLINGGEQEMGQRGGTSNAFANMVFAKTLRLALENEAAHRDHIHALHERMLAGLREINGAEINSPANALDCIINFSYEAIPSEVMQNALNSRGFMVSARSTCESKSANTSYVLKAMGFSDRRASSCIRVCFSYRNTIAEVDAFLKELKEITKRYGKI